MSQAPFPDEDCPSRRRLARRLRLTAADARQARALGAVLGDERGVAAVIFAVALALLVPLMLGVFDIYLASSQRAQLQDALDAAALFAARSPGKTSAEVDEVGDAALRANLVLPSGATLVSSTFALQNDTVAAHAEVQIPPSLRDFGRTPIFSPIQRSSARWTALRSLLCWTTPALCPGSSSPP